MAASSIQGTGAHQFPEGALHGVLCHIGDSV